MLLNEKEIEKLSLTRLSKTGLFKRMPVTGAHEDAAYRLLYRTVIDLATIDTFSQNREIKKEAEDWFSLENTDFKIICELADLPADRVLETVNFLHKNLKGEKAKFVGFKKKNETSN